MAECSKPLSFMSDGFDRLGGLRWLRGGCLLLRRLFAFSHPYKKVNVNKYQYTVKKPNRKRTYQQAIHYKNYTPNYAYNADCAYVFEQE